MSTKKAIILTLTATMMMTLCGCTKIGPYGSIPSEKEVHKEVERICPTEELEWYATEDMNEIPKRVVYHIRSTERDLEFEAISTLDDVGMFKPNDTPFYREAIKFNYVDVVQDQYTDLYLEAKGNVTYGGNTIYYTDDSTFQEIAANIVMLSDIYAPELEYNSEEWMKEHPIGEIALVWTADTENPKEGNKVRTIVIEIDGCLTYDDVMNRMNEAYNEKVNSGEVPAKGNR